MEAAPPEGSYSIIHAGGGLRARRGLQMWEMGSLAEVEVRVPKGESGTPTNRINETNGPGVT
jgi:hypothetical protein